MKTFRNIAMAAVILFLSAPMMSVLAQGPLHKEINFTINSPFAFTNGKAVFPAGSYILFQVNKEDSNLFFLYQDDRTHSPIATVKTVRINYKIGNYPGETRMVLTNDEEMTDALPIIDGWNIPGEDGWEIVGTVTNRAFVTESVSGMSSANYKKNKVRIVMTTSDF